MIKEEASFKASVVVFSERNTHFTIYWNLIMCSFQTLAGYLCLDFCVAISLHYVAINAGTIENAGLGLAYTCVSILLTPFGFGFNQSLNLHASQALGDQKVRLAKRYLTLNFYIIILSMIPLSGLLYALKIPLQQTIHEDREATSDAAWIYLEYLLPANIIALVFESFKTYMIAYKITYPFTFIHLTTTFAHWFCSWYFIQQLDMGIKGAGIAILITESLNVVGLIGFVFLTKLRTTVFADVTLWYNPKNLNRLLVSYLKSSWKVVLHLYSEFFVFFLLSFVALSLGTNTMNAHLAVQSTSGFVFRYAVSLSLALMSFVGTEMGNGNVSQAQKYVKASVILYLGFCLVIITVFYIFEDTWLEFYASDKEVQKLLKDLFIWMIAGVFLIDGLQGTLNGALKGIDKINLVTYSTLIAYYTFCIPMVFVFAYDWGFGFGIVGVWQAFALSNLLMATLFTWALLSTDWYKQSETIKERVAMQNHLHKSIVQVEDIE